jgi:hypothetical protein
MALTFDDNTALDKFNRCKREASFLDQELTTDGFVRFAETAWHLRDWIVEDATVPQSAKEEVLRWKTTKPIPELGVCQDIANSNKHMQIKFYEPDTVDATSSQGFGVGRFGRGGFGMCEQKILITMNDGTVYDALQVVCAVLKLWEDFLARHGVSVRSPADIPPGTLSA